MKETELRIGQLAGALTEPNGDGATRAPLVLMIHGSGPLDRNENGAGQKLDVFNAIAAALAERGIASFRYDKRGCGASGGDYITADQTDLLADAASCLDRLQAQFPNRFGARFLLGHSEGTMIAARLCQQREVDGLVLICPYLTDMETILMKQAREVEATIAGASGVSGAVQRFAMRMLGRPANWQARLIRKLKETETPTIRFMGRRMPARWLRECLRLDHRAIYAGVDTATLVVGGEKDLQCDPADVPQIEAILGARADAHVIANMTHLLRAEPGEATFASYPKQMKQKLMPELFDLVTDWIASQHARPAA